MRVLKHMKATHEFWDWLGIAFVIAAIGVSFAVICLAANYRHKCPCEERVKK